MRRTFAIGLTLALSGCGMILGGRPDRAANPSPDYAAFRACVDREAPAAFANAMKAESGDAIWGYHTEIDNVVVYVCGPGLGSETLNDYFTPSNRYFSYVNDAVMAQANIAWAQWEKEDIAKLKQEAAVGAEQEKVEKRDEDQAKSAYFSCLVQHAKTLALVSSETADIVAQAALSSCSPERATLVDVMNLYIPSAGYQIADGLDVAFTRSLLLEIVKARAAHSAPTTAPAKPNNHTPI